VQAFLERLEQDLARRQQNSLYRAPRIVSSPSGPEMELDGEQLLTFCSNDYLGLANHPDVKKAFVKAANQWGAGSGSAHLVTGHTQLHQQLEEALAAFTGHQRALLFSSGYMANLALLNGLTEKGDHVFQDKLNHASLIDSGRLMDAKMYRYLHADVSSLGRQLATVGSGQKFVVTDGVFSMDGDIAPLREMAFMAQDDDFVLMVDDAHGLGVLGENGRGSMEHFKLGTKQVPVLMGTLGKALGCAGAFIAADEVVIETLIQRARPYIYTTAQPAAMAAATLKALQLAELESWRREHLQTLIKRFSKGARQLGLPLMHSMTPIQPILAGTAVKALSWAEQLRQRQILVTAIRPPTVPDETARLRITFSAAHSESQVDRLLDALARIIKQDVA